MNQDFEKYVQRRLAQSGAMTPGQKLEVVRELIEEAQEGKVPVGENAVARLPLDHPAVQAVLRGEEVSMGGTVVRNDKGFKGLADRRVAMGLMIGSMFIMVLTLVFGSRLIYKTPEPTPTPAPSLTPAPTPTQPPTQIPPTPLPPPTAIPAFSLGVGGPAENSRDPASLEISGRLFIVSRGIVDDNGKWAPAGPEWLEGTEVRRVFSVQYNTISDLPVQPGDRVLVRTRGGAVLEYKVSEVLHLMANQIETFISLRPSVVIFVPVGGGDANTSERIAILAEAPLASSSIGSSETVASTYIHARTNAGVNLRKDPGLTTDVIQGLAQGTALAISNYPPVTVNGVNWIYVAVVNSNGSNGWIYGWLAAEYVTYQ